MHSVQLYMVNRKILFKFLVEVEIVQLQIIMIALPVTRLGLIEIIIQLLIIHVHAKLIIMMLEI